MKRLFLLLIVFLVTGCQSPPGPPPPAPPSAPSPTATPDKDGFYTTKGGVRYQILREGPGVQAVPQKNVKVDYVGTLQTGKTFDSTYERKQPFVFTLGNNEVIQGWEEGLLGMRVGEKRKLIVPPGLGYGVSGYQGVIPPNATLYFTIELLEVY